MNLTDYLAIYAAVLSTGVFVWTALQSRARIKVDLVFSVDGSGDEVKSGIGVIVRNVSGHEIHLAGIDILYPYKHVSLRDRVAHLWSFKRFPRRIGWVHSRLSLYSIESGCPIRLEPRQSHHVFLDESIVEEILAKATERRLIACVHDQLWNRVYSRAFEWSYG